MFHFPAQNIRILIGFEEPTENSLTSGNCSASKRLPKWRQTVISGTDKEVFGDN